VDAALEHLIRYKWQAYNSKFFIQKSADLFYQSANFNVLIVFRASDMNKLEYDYRVSNEHISEIKYILDYARENLKKPIWLVGTSRGNCTLRN
jgi:predicted alpha/beta-fold hydrolase